MLFNLTKDVFFAGVQGTLIKATIVFKPRINPGVLPKPGAWHLVIRTVHLAPSNLFLHCFSHRQPVASHSVPDQRPYHGQRWLPADVHAGALPVAPHSNSRTAENSSDLAAAVVITVLPKVIISFFMRNKFQTFSTSF